MDRVALVGREGGTLVCELLGERGAVPPSVLEGTRPLRARAGGVRRGAVRGGGDRLPRGGGVGPGDLAAVELAGRAEALIREPVPEGWDGLFAQTAKL